MNSDHDISARAASADRFVHQMQRQRTVRLVLGFLGSLLLASGVAASLASAASPCDGATQPGQCAQFNAATLPPFVQDAIAAKGGVLGMGDVLVLGSGDPADPDTEISNDMSQNGCGTNPDGWETYDCVQLDSFVPGEDSVVLALSSEWYEWYQTIFTDWMTISGAGVPTVDVSINSWIDNKVDIIPYGPWETGVVILTSLSAQKMVNFRVADSGDHIYDTNIVVVPASWFSGVNSSNGDKTILCGDDKLDPGEECDDGNNVTDDGCSSLCLGSQPPGTTPTPSTTCGNLSYTMPGGSSAPYTCGADLCGGFRCVVGNTISAACYTAAQCSEACAGSCVDVQTAQLDCATMCSVQPPANEPPPVLPQICEQLAYVWPDGTTMPYTCDDDCHGQRCVTGSTIDPECFKGDDCDATTCPTGSCVDTPPDDCTTFCTAANQPTTCDPDTEAGHTRPAVNQNGPCHGNVEVCKNNGEWRLTDASFAIDDERCNGIDDDCNGVIDDMFETCGDPGLCQNTVNTCDPANPLVPVVCVTLPQPSPVEICNNGLDDDCEGSVDDGCECGDDECMPGETYANCPGDCPPPANFTACEDGNLCTTGETWHNGICNGGMPVVCDAENACVTAGACNPATGCSATKVNCDDGIDCTADTCDSVLGCQNTTDDSACADGDACTIDTCDAAAGCASTPDPLCAGQDLDGDGYIAIADGGDDCNDADDSVNPGAVESCNGIDDNCDTEVDEGFGAGAACESSANSCGVTASGVMACTEDGLGVACDATPPADPVGYGNACNSGVNSCGQVATGTIGCDGFCSVGTPPDPAGYGDACNSAPNACGAASVGTVDCEGTCSAVTPVAVDSDSDATPDCLDQCPNDAPKTEPGECGCAAPDTDSNSNGIADCKESARADLAAGVKLNTKKPRGGKRMVFRLDVTNNGPSPATPATTITATVTGAPVSALKLPKTCSGTPAAITCTLPALKAGKRKGVTISFIPAAATTVALTSTVSSPVLDVNAANQSATLVTVIP